MYCLSLLYSFSGLTTTRMVKHVEYTVISKLLVYLYFYATRQLSRSYLRSDLVKNTAGAHKEVSKKYKINLEEQAHIDNLLTAELRDYAELIKFLNISKT